MAETGYRYGGGAQPGGMTVMTLKGKHLIGADGADIGEVKDVVGMDGNAPTWLRVKTGVFSQRMVPFAAISEADGRLETDLTAGHVKSAPKVPSDVEPLGDDLDALRQHYRIESP